MRPTHRGILTLALALACPGLVGAQGVAIDHKKVDCIVAGKYPRMNACFTPPGQGSRRVYFRPEGVELWYYVEMKSNAPCFEGVLPRPSKKLVAKHIYYYVEMVGPSGGRTLEYDPVVVKSARECKKDVVAPYWSNASVTVYPSMPALFVAGTTVPTTALIAAGSVAVAGAGVAYAATRGDDTQTITTTTPPGPTTPPVTTVPITAPPPSTTPPSPLTVQCRAEPRSGLVPLAVNFATFAQGGTGGYDFSWQFGDGGTAGRANPSHTYEAAGTFTATVEVRSGDQQIVRCSREITVLAPPPPPPPAPGPFTLTVTLSGSGTGTVTSAPPGINCNPDCTEAYASGTVVTLTATPTGGSTFGGWTGGGCSGTGTCTVTMSAAQTVNALFNAPGPTFLLTVNLAAGGTGGVTSNPAGINCAPDCTEIYPGGTVVVLTATPTGGSSFAGWTGGGCSGTGTCTVTMNAAQTVTATFNPPISNFLLTVVLAGSGTGGVTSNPPGITCNPDCTEQYPSGTVVVLTATPTGGSSFGGWSGGGCSGTGTCTVTMNAAQTVTATFNPAVNFLLTVILAGNGSGSVASNPPGISCNPDCTEPYPSGTIVVLTATANAGSSFGGWSGGGCSGTGTCTVTMNAAQTVTATFNPCSATLNVTTSGTGSGNVVSSPPGIDSPGGEDCTEAYACGTPVTLRATADSGSNFVTWSGGGCSGTGPCNLIMNVNTTVDARFDLTLFTLTVRVLGRFGGTGTVVSAPTGINCDSSPNPPGNVCTATFPFQTNVRLTGTVTGGGSTPVQWAADCLGTPQGNPCDLGMTQDHTADAIFDAGFSGPKPLPTTLRWVSELQSSKAAGQIFLNGGSVGAIRHGRTEVSGTPRQEANHVEALLTEGQEPGTWRFELPANELEPDSLRPLLGEVVLATPNTLVFRIQGKAGERVSFTFRTRAE